MSPESFDEAKSAKCALEQASASVLKITVLSKGLWGEKALRSVRNNYEVGYLPVAKRLLEAGFCVEIYMEETYMPDLVSQMAKIVDGDVYGMWTTDRFPMGTLYLQMKDDRRTTKQETVVSPGA